LSQDDPRRVRRKSTEVDAKGAGSAGIVVNGYSEQWLRRGFPWVYRNEVLGRTGHVQPGAVVEIRAREGDLLGVGIWDDAHVEVRRFRSDAGAIDGDLLLARVRRARARRALPPETDAYRWVHAENDDLPGIRVDVWGAHLVVSLSSPALLGLLEPLCDALSAEHPAHAIWLQWRLHDEDTRDVTGLPVGRVRGAPGADEVEVEVRERGLRAGVRPWEGHDVGMYCDMRDLRAWMEPHWAGRSVLNLFAHTAMFSVAAARAGARGTASVDLSRAFLDRAEANFRRNGLDPAVHRFIAEDSFKALDGFRRKGELFDVVIVDPPSFSHSAAGKFSVAQDLGRLVGAALRVLSPDGWLIVASNLGSMAPREFQKHILAGSHKVGRPLHLVHQGNQPIDFPSALDFPESRYLKAWVLRG